VIASQTAFQRRPIQQSDSQQLPNLACSTNLAEGLLQLPVIFAGQLLNRENVICSTIVAGESQGAGFSDPSAKLH
jgi:hypothetical protein